jgi:hypothetical protein
MQKIVVSPSVAEDVDTINDTGLINFWVSEGTLILRLHYINNVKFPSLFFPICVKLHHRMGH